jgi:protein SCO1/2
VPRTPLLAAALAAALGLTACSVGTPPSADGPVAGVTIHDGDGLHGAVLPDPYAAPALALSSTGGTDYRLDRGTAEAGDDLTLVFFGYTNCPDICHVVMADIASALTRLDEQQRDRVGMQFVTTDPARDDSATLRSYLDRFDPSFGGLTGPLPRIVEVGNALGVPVEKGEKMPSGGYEVNHGTQIVGVLPDGTAPVVWTEGTGPELIADDLRTILTDGIPSGASS